MAAVNTDEYNFTLRQGNDFVPVISVKNSDGTAKNLTGTSEAFFTVRQGSAYAAAYVLQKILGGGVTLTDAVNGVVTVVIADTETALLSPGERYVYDLEITLNNVTLTVLTGLLIVKESVTRSF